MGASAPPRPVAPTRKQSNMRPPPAVRPNINRAQTATPTLNGRTSPPDGIVSRQRTPKRKAPLDLLEPIGGEETNINVVVRCRGRNDRELRENSAVVVSSDGIKGKKVELSMGPNALSNKAYQFDKVFSPAADQGMIFDEVVAPILDEVLAGFNCTIFAYGQTGTGKTYTMSGDITDMLPIPDAAGIIPRVLHTLFDKLDHQETNDRMDTSVKCSFIELYNEELRDLLAADEGTKLKIFDDTTNKNGRTTTLVQGMEETHIQTASKGIQLLREGSHRRQVAATKCNDLSSRSHTVFTMTIYVKQISESGEEHISASKLNLVDLAGSENIQRSGAENKRATEAGLINKSLLTLGRVINALVDRSSHIPYRESKLTRLLQDSLGGKTKTCIIATLSPAKSNLEETISTLDYAFRAKNIRNKPQLNQLVSKKTLLREFTVEIEKLKSELIATRHRNGFYLTAEAYEELTTESESRRILSEEQRDKIETMEVNLRNKVQELFALTTNFQTAKKDGEKLRGRLESSKDLLDKTEVILAHTKRNLAEEQHLRKAHQETEAGLIAAGEEMRSTIALTTEHINRLQDKVERNAEMQALNQTTWQTSQERIARRTANAEAQLDAVSSQQTGLITDLQSRIQGLVKEEITAVQDSQRFLRLNSETFKTSQSIIEAQGTTTLAEMNQVLGEVRTLRDGVKQKVGEGLDSLSTAAQRISIGIAHELETFHTQLQNSYASLGRECKTLFDDMVSRMETQNKEILSLQQKQAAMQAELLSAGDKSRDRLQQDLEKERQASQAERDELMQKISSMINDTTNRQEKRIAEHIEASHKRIKTSESDYRISNQAYDQGMAVWTSNSQALFDSTCQARDSVKQRLQHDWKAADERISEVTGTSHAVYTETTKAVDSQMQHMDEQLVSLDEIVNRVKAQSEEHHHAHTQTLARMAGEVQASYRDIEGHFDASLVRTRGWERSLVSHVSSLHDSVQSLKDGEIRESLQQMNGELDSGLATYTATGDTPTRTQYAVPTMLVRTKQHDVLIDGMRSVQPGSPSKSPIKSPVKRSAIKRLSPSKIPLSPGKTQVFVDRVTSIDTVSLPVDIAPLLREVDANINPTPVVVSSDDVVLEAPQEIKLKPSSGKKSTGKMGGRKDGGRSEKKTYRTVEGRENIAPHANEMTSTGPGRSLRSRTS